MRELTLVVAEDNLLVREGVLRLVAEIEGLRVAASCSSFDDLLAAVDNFSPDVVVTDIRMPPDHRDEGIRAANRFRASHPELGVLVLSQFLDPAYVLALLEAGTRGRGYLLKDRVDEVDRLARAIRTVADGGSYIDDDVVDVLVRSQTRSVDSPLESLSTREIEVLTEMATGATNAAIAESLCLSAHSVEKHASAIFAKLGLAEDVEINRRVKAVVMFLAGRDPAEPVAGPGRG
ncbi:response regulator transcription factor [Nocardioides sp.]|uniref:response regulator transcription factor n=1 Tax=Nocardioides sp. TaxID=35761 RepID=UPI001A28E1BF|nr:response regulator transcription factor [Nocardioides sp.]MBJ7356188.1 response regulator transcription factor [Nocardioides sp.]